MNKGIQELNVLLSTMEPYLDVDEYVFHTLEERDGTENMLALEPVGFLKKKKG